MTDRELLELAGLAGNIPKRVMGADGGIYNCDEHGWHRNWNPLESDADALRLAVRLSISIDQWPAEHGEDAYVSTWESITEDHAGDACAATRRAITRAAAEIGKAKS